MHNLYRVIQTSILLHMGSFRLSWINEREEVSRWSKTLLGKMTDEWNAMKDWAIPQSKLSANKELHNSVSNVVYRQTNKMGRFDLGRFDFGMFWLGTFWLGTFWLWNILTLGRFDFGTFWLGMFWLWHVLTLGRFDFGTFWPVCSQKLFASSSLIKYSENILGTFWLTKNGTFWQITWDVLVLGRFDLGHFDFGMFWLGHFDLGRFDSGTFWLWHVLTWDDLTLGHFDQCVHKNCLLSRVWLNIVKIYLGRFDSPIMGRFGKSLRTFWFWDVLTYVVRKLYLNQKKISMYIVGTV